MGTLNSVSFALLVLLLRSPLFVDKLNFDYIFQFGDSINDTGNLEWDEKNSLCGKFPYGQALEDGIPARCSDGLIMIDRFAKFFNVPLSPYLDAGANHNLGVNFAVAGSTALDPSTLQEQDIPSPFTNSSLSVQLTWFKSHLRSLCKTTSECKEKLQKALFFMGEIGGNDYNFGLMWRKPMEDLYKMVPDVVQAIKNAAEELINLGAVTMVIPGNFPMGCIPLYLVQYQSNDTTMYDELHCLNGFNDFAKFHNDHVQEAIKELRQKHSHVTIVYADYYAALRWVIKNAPSLGFDKDEVQKPCCGFASDDTNRIPVMCGGEGVPVCADPSKRISWDGVHFTQHAYENMAQWLLQRIVPNILVQKMIQVEDGAMVEPK